MNDYVVHTVGSIMTSDVITVLETSSLSDIKKLFTQHSFHHLPVVDDDGMMKGIISKEDVAKAIYFLSLNTTGETYTKREFNHISAKEVMSVYPVFLTPEDDVNLAADIFLSNKMHALPILDNGQLVGIVTTHDLLRYAFTLQHPNRLAV